MIKISELSYLAGKYVWCGVRPINKTLHEYDIPCLQYFFPWLYFYVNIKSSNLKKPRWPHTAGPQTLSTKNLHHKKPNPRPQPQNPNPKPP